MPRLRGSYGPLKPAPLILWVNFKILPIWIPPSLVIRLPVEGLVVLQTAQARKESQMAWLPRNVLFRRTHTHLEAGRGGHPMTQTFCPAHALSHSLLQSVPDLFSQCSTPLTLPPCSKIDTDSPLCAMLAKTPLPAVGDLPREARVVSVSHLPSQGSPRRPSAAANSCPPLLTRPSVW